MKKKLHNEGITLVALVVTVIVLLILAGITISLVLGQNGIITKAQQSKDLSANADKATQEGLNNLYGELENSIENKTKEPIPTTVATAIGKELSEVDNTPIKDDNGNTVTIPAGFKVASDSPTKQEDGIVIEDGEGNQFVWIPVANISNYARTDFGKYWSGYNYTNFSETIPSDEQASVSTYHGYYIGRYEAGDNVSTASKTLRVSGASTTNKVAIKKGQVPYNFITRDQANTLSIGMKTAENYKVTTKLCSSYAWDTALNFIQNKVTDYATNPTQGNYYDTTFSYTDITGATQTKPSNSHVLIPTGETTPVCSLYDIGGNEWEWTTETCNDTANSCVGRGGNYYDAYLNYPAGYRYDIAMTYDGDISFRITLYM